jgi:hypothetical protein
VSETIEVIGGGGLEQRSRKNHCRARLDGLPQESAAVHADNFLQREMGRRMEVMG